MPIAKTSWSLGASRRDRAVLLTPGPYNESYFEHVYLAHYLGLTLVQGDDLAVRDGEVFLKTLTGLERVARHLPPRRFRFLRSPGISRRQRPGRARAWWKRCAPAAWCWPMRWAAA